MTSYRGGKKTKPLNVMKNIEEKMVKHTKHNPDYMKDKTADVVKHGSGRAVPNEQWQVNMNLTPQGSDSPEGAFLPRAAKNRPTTHIKVNECDY